MIQRAYEESFRGVWGVGDMVVAAGRKAWGERGTGCRCVGEG